MSLRLVAVDGNRVDRPVHGTPDFQSLTRRARDVLYMLTIGDVDVSPAGLFTLRTEHLARSTGWSYGSAERVVRELRDKGFIRMVEERRGARPRVWEIHEDWNPAILSQDQQGSLIPAPPM